MVQNVNWEQLCVSGCRIDYLSRLVAQSFAKSMTTASAEALAKAEQLTFSTYDKSIVSGTIQVILVNYCS
jgi:hypothetical protein